MKIYNKNLLIHSLIYKILTLYSVYIHLFITKSVSYKILSLHHVILKICKQNGLRPNLWAFFPQLTSVKAEDENYFDGEGELGKPALAVVLVHTRSNIYSLL